MGKRKFSEKLLTHPKYKKCLAKDPKTGRKQHDAHCEKSFNISNMSEAAITSHMEGEEHSDLDKALSAPDVIIFCSVHQCVADECNIMACLNPFSAEVDFQWSSVALNELTVGNSIDTECNIKHLEYQHA